MNCISSLTTHAPFNLFVTVAFTVWVFVLNGFGSSAAVTVFPFTSINSYSTEYKSRLCVWFVSGLVSNVCVIVLVLNSEYPSTSLGPSSHWLSNTTA